MWVCLTVTGDVPMGGAAQEPGSNRHAVCIVLYVDYNDKYRLSLDVRIYIYCVNVLSKMFLYKLCE